MTSSRTPERIRERRRTVAGRQVRYLDAGHGDTLVLLLHGWPQNADSWRPLIDRLVADGGSTRRLVAVDLPGIGGSEPPGRGFAKRALAGDLHAFVSTFDVEHLVVVGHDIGGMIAYAYARRFGHDVDGVAVLDVPLPGLAPWDRVVTADEAWHFRFHQQFPLAERLVAGRQQLYFRSFVDGMAATPGAIPDRDIARYADAYATGGQLTAGFELYRAFGRDATDNAAPHPPLRVPILLAGGASGMGNTVETLARSVRAAGATSVTTAVVPCCGHWMVEEAPAATTALVDDLIHRSVRRERIPADPTSGVSIRAVPRAGRSV